MKIYTKTGDKGLTSLLNGERVKKYDERVELYGTVDELNSILGLARANDLPEAMTADITLLQNLLFNLGSDLAAPRDPAPKFEVPRLNGTHILLLEKLIDKYDEELPPLKAFILPGGSRAAAHLHNARTVCRRCERAAVKYSEQADLGDTAVIFLNRLSDYFFTAARYANMLSGDGDVLWEK